jgi:hypothetical protein
MDQSASERAAPDADAAAMPEDMPCCPVNTSLPDCAKDCPLMALCVAVPLQSASQISLIVPLAFVNIVFPGDQSDLASVAQAPPRRPPKT